MSKAFNDFLCRKVPEFDKLVLDEWMPAEMEHHQSFMSWDAHLEKEYLVTLNKVRWISEHATTR